MSASATSYDQALSLFTSLSFTEKLSFVADATAALKKEGKTGSVGKAAKKEKKEKDADAPKRAMPAGTLAWLAFVAHCKTTMPERFEGVTQVSKKLTICKEIRGEDEEAYKKFADDFMAKRETASSPAVATKSPAASTEAKPKADTVEEKKKKIAEAKEAAKEAKEAAKEAKATVAAAKEAKPKKEPKKTKAAEAKVAPSMPKKEIDGEEYFTDPDTNGLWKIDEDDRLGAWVGYFQPDNADEPIRHTDSFADA